MWKMGRGSKQYRFQTDEKSIADKMKRRQKFRLVGLGINSSLWIFQSVFTRPDIAKKAFDSLIEGKAIFDFEEEIYYSEGKLSSPENKVA